MRAITVAVLALVMVSTLAIAGDSPKDFRGITWGMGMAKIIAVEGKKPIYKNRALGTDVLGYTDKLCGIDCSVFYSLVKNQLASGSYVVTQEHTNKADYLTDYGTLSAAISEKYGQSISADTNWKNELYKNEPANWGMAVAVGHLVKVTQWETPRTKILLAISGDNYTIRVEVHYASKELGYLLAEDSLKLQESKL